LSGWLGGRGISKLRGIYHAVGAENKTPFCHISDAALQNASVSERLFLRQKKSTIFFHARISRSGKWRVSDFFATRVRVEGVGSPRVAEKVTHKARTASEILRSGKNNFFL
jgi:hypothetical protein